MTEPTLSHDIEEWIKDHSHAAIYASLGRMYATHQLLEDRVAVLENGLFNALTKRVARLEAKQQTDRTMSRQHDKQLARLEEAVTLFADLFAAEHIQPQPPRGPHD